MENRENQKNPCLLTTYRRINTMIKWYIALGITLFLAWYFNINDTVVSHFNDNTVDMGIWK